MLLRHPSPPRAFLSASRRSAKAALALLLAMPAMLLAMAMAFYAAELVETKAMLHNASDAAALAGVQSFINDDLLRGDPNTMQELISRARYHAQQYAGLNLVMGQSLTIDSNVSNDPNGDIVVGTLATPRSKNFVLTDLTGSPNPQWLTINTVRVSGRRTDQSLSGPVPLHSGPYLSQPLNNVMMFSTATLDRFVIGFRPMSNWKPLPLSPLALFSHQPGHLKHCWEYQVERRRGPDQYKVQRNGANYQILNGSDGLHEMDVYLGTGKQQQQVMQASQTDLNTPLKQGRFNCCMLQLGTQEVEDLAQQLLNGVSKSQLSQFGGQLVLGAGNQLEVNGTPWGPMTNSSDGQMLQSALQQLQSTGTPLLWPCFSSFDQQTSNPVLCGFVAARVVNVNQQSGQGGGITFSVQPCMMPTATAVTDPMRAGVGIAKLPNPYICKVRLVE